MGQKSIAHFFYQVSLLNSSQNRRRGELQYCSKKRDVLYWGRAHLDYMGKETGTQRSLVLLIGTLNNILSGHLTTCLEEHGVNVG